MAQSRVRLNYQTSIRLSTQVVAQLQKIATKNNIKMTELIRRAIHEVYRESEEALK